MISSQGLQNLGNAYKGSLSPKFPFRRSPDPAMEAFICEFLFLTKEPSFSCKINSLNTPAYTQAKGEIAYDYLSL